MKNVFGALKPKADKRDYSVRAGAQASYPETYYCTKVDQIKVKNQKEVNSCVAHSLSSILETFELMESGVYETLSTNFIYGMQEREESGMYLREACKIAQKYGDPTEDIVPGNTEQPACGKAIKGQLNDTIIAAAANHKVKSYAQCKTGNDIKYALMNYGPLLGSIKWYDKHSFKEKSIIMDKTSPFGYHAIMVYGWNEEGWLCQNSWGKKWNGDGKFIFPYTEKFTELWSFIDETDENLHKPNTSGILNIIYKIINSIINIFNK